MVDGGDTEGPRAIPSDEMRFQTRGCRGWEGEWSGAGVRRQDLAPLRAVVRGLWDGGRAAGEAVFLGDSQTSLRARMPRNIPETVQTPR